jgi:membrane-associated protease RseP (regulator of RpoE activity)
MPSDSKRADEVEAAFTSLGLDVDELLVDEADEGPVQQRAKSRWKMPLLLLFATLASMTWVGLAAWSPMELLETAVYRGSLFEVRRHILANWFPGLLFSVSLTIILGAHELGHYFATRLYGIRSSLPIFIPFPVSPIGTCGAVILMDGHQADRRQIFDIGLAGPLAGLVFALPIAAMGLMYGEPPKTRSHSMQFGQPIVVQALAQVIPVRVATKGNVEVRRPVVKIDRISNDSMNPMLMAAWVGFLITGVNMVPISQLDGGHVIHGLLGRDSAIVSWIAYAACCVYVAFTSIMFKQPMFILMILLIPLMGVTHPPSRNDSVSLGFPRQIIGAVSLVLPFLCIPLQPIVIL